MSRVDPLDNLKNFEVKDNIEKKTEKHNKEIENIANEHGFVGRESTPLKSYNERPRRRHKTGRNIQINIKGDLETKNELYRIADLIDQPLGETLKRALSALQTEIDNGGGDKKTSSSSK